jgi:hypothetical protein
MEERQMTASRDDLEVPSSRCRQCGAYVPEIEIERNICLDCQIENQKRRKKKGYRNDIHSSDEASE